MPDTHKETLGFQAEVKQLLNIMINSLYSNKEIFLRELISNASDAAEKLRFEALANNTLYENDHDLKIWVDFNKDKHTITITDNGIGMTRDEMIKNLGTIAKSGTREFLNTLTGDKPSDTKLIGQFGVGFYSAFIVAEKVEVISRKAGDPIENGTRWISEGKGEYEIETVRKSKRGTEVTLYLKKEEDEFLNGWHLRHVITKYSDHITLPVVMKKEKTADDPDKKDSKIIDVPAEEVINKATALWTLPRQEITDEQYKEFYKHIAHDFEDPLAWSLNKVEGKLEYTSLLYIPTRAPFDLWYANRPKGLKLYVQRVFIMDNAEQFLPNYLRFVRGIIDSKDLPLNISREILQGNKIIDSIRSAIIKRVLSMLEQLATNESEKYQTFWQEFGQVLKEGPAEDFSNKEQIAKLLRFNSTHSDATLPNVSLLDYVSRMQDKQNKIYYIAADTANAAKHSPHLEIFRQKNIEVLLLSDKVDEWLMAHLTEFDGKPFQSIAKGDLELPEGSESKDKKELEKQASGEFKDTLEKIKKLLTNEVKEVRLTGRLIDSPACIVTDVHDMSLQMEKIMKAAGQKTPVVKPILELNPNHIMVKRLHQEQNETRFNDWSWILFEQAVLAAGGQLQDPAAFVHRFNKLLLELVG